MEGVIATGQEPDELFTFSQKFENVLTSRLYFVTDHKTATHTYIKLGSAVQNLGYFKMNYCYFSL